MKPTHFFTLTLLAAVFGLSNCSEDEDFPAVENEEEIIAEVRLTFSPVGSGNTAVFTFSDPDGEGPAQPVLTTEPLSSQTAYELAIELAGPNGENITEELLAEADEHMLFFGWEEGLFSEPSGNGNLDAREEGAVHYKDEDAAGLPLGLFTSWKTGEVTSEARDFTLILKHQPNSKSATSDVNVGETDIQLSWAVTVQD